MDRVTIKGEDGLYRRIHPNHIKPDRKISSAAFKGSDSDELSVDLAKLTSPEEVLDRAKQLGKECIGIGELVVQAALNLGQEVRYDPLGPEDKDGPNPAHTLIVGKKTDPIAKSLARSSNMILWT